MVPELTFYAGFAVLYIMPVGQILYASIGMMMEDMKVTVPFGIFYILS